MNRQQLQLSFPIFFLVLLYCTSVQSQTLSSMDLSMYCPIPGNQGPTQACTGWAVGYGAMTIEKARQVNQRNRPIITRNAYSAAFLYNQLNGGDCQKGSTIQTVLTLAKNKGNCLAGQFDRLIRNCGTLPKNGLQQKASANKIKGFQRLFSHQKNTLHHIESVRKMIAVGKPVIVSLQVEANFYKIPKGAKYYWPHREAFSGWSGHAMVVVGYDDKKQAFRLLNSFGTDWGDNGFIWVKYQLFAERCRGAYIIYL